MVSHEIQATALINSPENASADVAIFKLLENRVGLVTYLGVHLHLGITEKPTRDCISCIIMRALINESKPTKRFFSTIPLLFGAHSLGIEPREYSHKPYTFITQTYLPIFSSLIRPMCVYVHTLLWRAPKKTCILKQAIQGHPRWLILVRIESALCFLLISRQ